MSNTLYERILSLRNITKMTKVKDIIFEREKRELSPYATYSFNSQGRKKEEPLCPMRTDFQRDRDRIIYCMAFKRLKNKTQVFFSPEGDHYMTRLTHTLDVSQIARSISRCLSLNEDLTEAIALGHDLGHTPFGHAGERALNSLTNGGFSHNVQSRRVAEALEKNGQGLNLTYEVLDGIENHRKKDNPKTLEGKVVSLADRIAYINHDINDAVRAGIIKESDLPKKEISLLGFSSRERINNMISSIITKSLGKNQVSMEDSVYTAMESVRDFMFERVYLTEENKIQEEKAKRMIECLFNFFVKNTDKLPAFYQKLLESYDKERVVCDYLSSMTDRFAVHTFKQIFVPKSWAF